MEARLALPSFRKERRHVLLLLFVAYVGYYFCRVSLNIAKPMFKEDFGFNNEEIGWITSTYFGVYAISKLLNGYLGDRLGGKTLLLLGIAGTVLCNAFMGFGTSLGFFIAVWAINAFFQSAGWPAMMSSISQWYPSRESGRAVGALSLSYTLGDVLARYSGTLIIGGLIITASFNWDEVFWVHAAGLSVIGVLVWKMLRPTPAAASLPDVDEYAAEAHVEVETSEPSGGGTSYRRQLLRMLSSRWLWFACLTYLALSTIRYIFWTWSIEYLDENSETLDLAGATLTSAIYPLMGCLGTIAAGWLSDRMGGRRGPVILLMTSLLIPALYTFSVIPGNSVGLMALNLGAIGFLLYGPYSLMAGAMAIDFGSKHSAASAAGIIDAVGAIGAILAGAGMGSLIDSLGWTNAFTIVIVVGVVAALLSATMWNFKPLPHEPTKSGS